MKRFLAGVLLLLSCSACDFQGLDLNQPSDARKYVQACARGAEAIHCRAMLPFLTTTTGEVTVILPNMGDTEIAAALRAYAQRTGQASSTFETSAAGRAYARANIFLVPQLRTGTMTSLDGKAHTVVCQEDATGAEGCVIDGFLSGGDHLASYPDAVGSIFSSYNLKDGKAETAFLPF